MSTLRGRRPRSGRHLFRSCARPSHVGVHVPSPDGVCRTPLAGRAGRPSHAAKGITLVTSGAVRSGRRGPRRSRSPPRRRPGRPFRPAGRGDPGQGVEPAPAGRPHRRRRTRPRADRRPVPPPRRRKARAAGGSPPRSATTRPGWPAREASGLETATSGSRARRHWRAASPGDPPPALRPGRRPVGAGPGDRALGQHGQDAVDAQLGELLDGQLGLVRPWSGRRPRPAGEPARAPCSSRPGRLQPVTGRMRRIGPPVAPSVGGGDHLSGPQAQHPAQVVAVVAVEVELFGQPATNTWAEAAAPPPSRQGLLEGGADAGEEAFFLGRDRLAPQLGQPAQERRPPRPMSLSGMTTSTWTSRSPRPRPRREGTPRPRSRKTRPLWVPAGTTRSSSPSKVSIRRCRRRAPPGSWGSPAPGRGRRRGAGSGSAGGRTRHVEVARRAAPGCGRAAARQA